MKLIEVQDLSFKYAGGGDYAIKDISLEVHEGEFIVLAGRSGCGKTTLLRCMNGLIPHFYEGEFEGRVLVDGIDTRESSPHILSQIVGMVFQNPDNQLFALTVEADIAFALENLGLPREEIRDRVEWVLKLMKIEDLRERAPFELSGGQKQKVAIASILAMKPRILLLDEPTSSLDPLSAKNLIESIVELNRKERLAIIISEHRLNLLLPYADRLIIMDHGRKVYDDYPRKVMEKEVLMYGVASPAVVEIAQRIMRGGGCRIFERLPLSVDEFISGIRGALK